MKERPILFSAPMIQAILEGRKTQTRRIVKPSIVEHIEFMGDNGEEPPEFDFVGIEYGQRRSDSGKEMPAEWLIYCTEYPEEGAIPIGQVYGAVGDRLWVRETFARDDEDGHMLYRTDDNDDTRNWDQNRCESGLSKYRWRPSIHMPRWASRINLEITGVRIQRLQDIGQGDACAEGCPAFHEPINWYSALWEELNGSGSWDANPWVWVIEFRKI